MELRAYSVGRAHAFLLLATAGCMVLDGRPEIHLWPPGPIYTTGWVTLRVEAPHATEARIVVDGTDAGHAFQVGSDFTFYLAPVAGRAVRHRIVARVQYGTQVSDSPAVDVIVELPLVHPPQFTVSPPGGSFFSTAPFAVTLDFDRSIDPASVSPSTVRLMRGYPAQSVPATVTLSSDGRRIVLETSSPLDELGPVELAMDVHDYGGLWASARGPLWYAPALTVGFPSFPPDAVSGVTGITGEWYAGAPDQVDVLIDGVIVGRIATGETLPWDTRLWPEGEHELRLDAPGYAPSYPWRVVVDNTPPRVVSCAPVTTAPDDASVQDGIDVFFSECICWNSCSFGSCRTWTRESPPPDLVLPTTYRFGFPGARDVAGNALPVTDGCTVSYPAWRKPWGTAPLAWGGPGPPEELVILSVLPARADVPDAVDLLYVAPGDPQEPAAVRKVHGQAGGAWALDPSPLNVGPLAPAPQLRVDGYFGIWLEDQGGSWTIRRWIADPQYRSAVEIPGSAGPVEMARFDWAWRPGWVETSAAGIRELRIGTGQDALGAWTVSPPANTAAADASAPALGQQGAAFLETPAGGVSQLRVRRWDGTAGQWVSVGDVLNRDPSIAASEPTLDWSGDPTLVWVEGDRVLARRGDSAGGWSAPQDLLADTGTRAGSPRAFSGRNAPRILFVAHGIDGDRFEVRQWDWQAGAWGALEALQANGTVTSWDMHDWPFAVVWSDSSGGPYLRVYNE